MATIRLSRGEDVCTWHDLSVDSEQTPREHN
jgi:hypothetical protein